MKMIDVVNAFGEWAHGGDPEGTTREWELAGFDPEQAREWLEAGCFDAWAARKLADAGFTPELAATRTDAGIGNEETIAYKVSNGDLTVYEAAESLWKPGMCELAEVRSALQLVDWQPEACVRPASHTFYFTPPSERGSAIAARNAALGREQYRLCESCAKEIADLLEQFPDEWAGVDEVPDPLK